MAVVESAEPEIDIGRVYCSGDLNNRCLSCAEAVLRSDV
jgi:hypothetical protein